MCRAAAALVVVGKLERAHFLRDLAAFVRAALLFRLLVSKVFAFDAAEVLRRSLAPRIGRLKSELAIFA